MNHLIDLDECHRELTDAVHAIQQPRTDFELAHFVVGQHDTEARQWAQCVLELQIKIQALRRARILQRRMERKIRKLERKGSRKALDKAEMLRIDVEDHSLAVVGATREAQALWAIYKAFPRTYSRQELNALEPIYWERRLVRQALQDANAAGRIGVANQDALRMLGHHNELESAGTGEVERRFLAVGKTKLLVVVPTLIGREVVRRDGLRCLDGWSIPGTFEHRIYVVQGQPIADAYNDAARTAILDRADFMLCVEDDHIVPAGTFERLWATLCEAGERTVVAAWYPQRKDPRTGSAIVVADGRRAYLDDDGSIHEVHGVTQGFTLIPTAVFREVRAPWFVSTASLTQDAFFSQLAREAGFRLLVDTSAKIKHVDRKTGRVFE